MVVGPGQSWWKQDRRTEDHDSYGRAFAENNLEAAKHMKITFL